MNYLTESLNSINCTTNYILTPVKVHNSDNRFLLLPGKVIMGEWVVQVLPHLLS